MKQMMLSKCRIKLDGLVAGIWKWVPIGVSHAHTPQQLWIQRSTQVVLFNPMEPEDWR